jgi:heme exporter protein D
MVEHAASGRDYSNTEQTNHRAAYARSFADNAGGLLDVFNRSGFGSAPLHHFGARAKRGARCRDGGLVMSQFFYMGGYGFYVWGSYIATLIVLGAEVLQLLRRRKSLREQNRR